MASAGRLGGSHAQTLDALGRHAAVLDRLARGTEAAALYRQVLDRRLARSGPRDPRRLRAMLDLLKADKRQGRPKDVAALHREWQASSAAAWEQPTR